MSRKHLVPLPSSFQELHDILFRNCMTVPDVPVFRGGLFVSRRKPKGWEQTGG